MLCPNDAVTAAQASLKMPGEPMGSQKRRRDLPIPTAPG